MSDQRIDTGKAPNVTVNCHGDLWIRAWAETALVIKGDHFTANQTDDGVEVTSSGHLKLFLPLLSTLTVGQVGGDLMIKGLDGVVSISEVHGDLLFSALNDVTVNNVNGDVTGHELNGSLTVESVHGDLNLRNILELTAGTVHGDCLASFVNGTAYLRKISGDVNLKTINGDVQIEECHRDVNLLNLGGQAKVILANGDIRIYGGLTSGKHILEAKGDIVVRWPLSAPLNVEATAPIIRNRLTLSDLVVQDGYLSGRIGDGETFLILTAKGRIILKEESSRRSNWNEFIQPDFENEVDLNDLSEQIAQEINDKMYEWSTKMEREFGPAITANVEKSVLKAASRAERAAEKAVRKAEKAVQKASWQMGKSNWTTPPVSNTLKPREKKATEEEQLKILRMVENGIISPEEANSLLEAIES